MKLSRHEGRHTKHAKRGRHTKRAGNQHTRRIKHRGKQYKRTYRKNNRKLKHNKRIQRGGVFVWNPPIETTDQNGVITSTSTTQPVLLTYRKQKYGNNLTLVPDSAMEESKYCSAELTFTPIGYDVEYKCVIMVFTLSLQRYQKNKAGPIDKHFVCDFTLYPIYGDNRRLSYHCFSTGCISINIDVRVNSTGDITQPNPLPTEFVLDGNDTGDTKSKTKYKFYDERKRTGDFFFRDLFMKISRIYVKEFDEFVIKDTTRREAEEQKETEKKIARERQIHQKAAEIQATTDYTSFKTELESKATGIKNEPNNLGNVEIRKQIDGIVQEILRQQLTLMVKESLFPDENTTRIVTTISGLQSQLENLSPALVKQKDEKYYSDRLKGNDLMPGQIGFDDANTAPDTISSGYRSVKGYSNPLNYSKPPTNSGCSEEERRQNRC